MNGMLTLFFVATTAEDQANYFSQERHPSPDENAKKGLAISPGVYRVVDGVLCRILVGLPLDEVRARLLAP